MIKRVLFADNVVGFLETRTEYLEEEGYQVIQARSPVEARRCMEDEWFHLAVLDIRMVDDSDKEDISGLELASDPQFSAVPKIILTNFSEFEYVRKALGQSESGVPPAVAYVDKAEEPTDFLKAVDRAFRHNVRVNFDLAIATRDGSGLPFQHLMSLILPSAALEKAGLLAAEVEDLFRRLFYEASQIVIGRVLWQAGGRAGVEVFAWDNNQWLEQYLVVVGGPQAADSQMNGGEELNRWARIKEHTLLDGVARTPHFSAAAMKFKGVDLEDCLPLFEFGRAASNKQAGALAAALLAEYVQPVSQPVEKAERADWTERAAAGWEHLRSGLARVTAASQAFELAVLDWEDPHLSVLFPGGQRVRFDLGGLDSLALQAALERGAGGRLMAGGHILTAALADRAGQVRLTDFCETAAKPALTALAEMELQLRFGLLDEPNLVSVYDFERQLANTSQSGQYLGLEQVEPGCRKALAAIQVVRQAVESLGGEERKDFPAALLGALLAQAGQLAAGRGLTRKETARWVHTLILAGLLTGAAEKGQPAAKPTGAETGQARLGLDRERGEVVCGARRVRLTPTEVKLLEYFASRPGEVCTREDLLRGVFAYPNTDDESADRLINTNMDRLRQKIGQAAGGGRFITTVRGKGYIYTPEAGE